ncbi:MAG TPA: hypothetical protein VF595_07990 [Tepidisphaeraceae bacterium]|jgi:hypothetical protein
MNKTDAPDFDSFVRSLVQGRELGPFSALLIEVAAELFQRERERAFAQRASDPPATQNEAA